MGQTLGNIYNNVNFALNLQTEAMARLQEQASTGARINRVSDGPSDAYQILGLNSQERSLENYMDNLLQVVDHLEISAAVIQNMVSGITSAKTSLTQIVNGIYGEDSRKRVAEGINDILEQVVLLANTNHNNQYLFGGTDSASIPYLVERTNGEITRVTYQGSLEGRNAEIAPAVQVDVSYVGDNIFRSDDRSGPIFLGNTGAEAGTGTSSVSGDVWLTVIHDGSNYKLSIDDGATYVTVPVGGDTNQPVTDSGTGQVLYVDSTGINSTGLDMVRLPGTYNVFDTLISIRDTLLNEKGLSNAKLQESLLNSLDSLDEITNLLVQTEVSLGLKIGFLSDLNDSLKNLTYNAEDEATRLEEADIAQIAVDLSRQEVLYQMSLQVAAKIMSMSLLDFLR